MDVMGRFMPMLYLLSLLLSGLFVATSVSAEPVKLAVLLPLSNVYKDAGHDAKQGFNLGVAEEVAAQKADWESWVRIEFFDTRVDKDHSLQVAKKAIAGGAKAILGLIASGIALALQDYVLKEAGVPMILCSGAVSAKLRTTHPLFIRTSRSIPLVSIALSRWFTEHPIVAGRKPRWACIHSDEPFGAGGCEAFSQAYGQVGEEIGRIPVPLKSVNKKRQIVQLAKLKPDFAYAVFATAENDTFFRDYYRFKVHQKIPLVSGSLSAITPKRFQAYEKTLQEYGTGEGFVTASPYVTTAENPANKQFVARYQQAYNEPPSIYAMWAYDGGRLLAKALIKRQGQWDGAKIVELMKNLPHISPRHGQQLRFDTHGDVINGAYILKTKRDKTQGDRLVNDVIGQVPPINIDDVLK